jgi:hypothetical protein
MKTTRAWMKKMKKIMERLCAVLVEKTMPLMNSGFAVTSARSGSMENVLRSPQLGLSISSSTNAHLAATREHGLDDYRVACSV